MLDCADIQIRLKLLIENRNFFFKDTPKSVAEKYLASKTIFSGLSNSEITLLEKELSAVFPSDFKQYLGAFGKNCGDLFCCGQDLNPEEFTDYQQWAKEIFTENCIDSPLADNIFVFSFHQGYTFHYFDKKDDNIAIYSYLEGDKEPKKVFENFIFFLDAELQHLEKINKEMSKTGGYFIIIHKNYQSQDHPTKSSGIIPREIGDNFS